MHMATKSIDPAKLPWIPLRPGVSIKPLRLLRDDRGFTELLRLDPGIVVPLHRHTGEVHAWNLEGSRKLDTGEVLGPMAYAFEPTGNVDSWEAVGEAPLVLQAVVTGAVEYLDERGQVKSRVTASTLAEAYRRYCAEQGVDALDLWSA
jgi:hypothetical protein